MALGDEVKPNYEAKKQYTQEDNDSPALDKVGKKFIQEVCRVFLFLVRAVDGGLLPALSSLAFQHANPTEKMGLCKHFLNFMATQEEAILTYHTSAWSSQSTATHRTSPNRNPAAALEATCSWPGGTKSLSTMGPSSIYHK